MTILVPEPIAVSIIALAKPAVKPSQKRVKVVKQNKKVMTSKLKNIATKEHAKKKLQIVKKIVEKVKEKPKNFVKNKEQVKNKKLIVTKNINHNKGKDVSTILHKAKYKKQTPIIYPKRALRRKQEGKVLLKVKISKHGLPLEVRVKHSSGFSLLDDAAIRTVRTWSFEPRKNGDTAITSWTTVPIRFKIEKNIGKI